MKEATTIATSQEKNKKPKQTTQNEIEDGVETSLWLSWLNKMYEMVDMKKEIANQNTITGEQCKQTKWANDEEENDSNTLRLQVTHNVQ